MTYNFEINDNNIIEFGILNKNFRDVLRPGNEIKIIADPDNIGICADVLGSNEDILQSTKTDILGSATLIQNVWVWRSNHHYGDYDRHNVLKALKAGNSVTLFARH